MSALRKEETTEQQLKRMVESIAKEITSGKLDPESCERYHDLDEEEKKDFEPTGSDYLDGVYDINWVINRDKSYRGAVLMVAGGGPNVYVNTETMQVEGYWGGDKSFYPFIDNIGLDDACEELYSCS